MIKNVVKLIPALISLMIILAACGGDGPKVKLHERVGEVYNDSKLYTAPSGEKFPGDGIIFHVTENGDSAYICSFTDLYEVGGGSSLQKVWIKSQKTWNTFGADTTLDQDTLSAQVYRFDKRDTVTIYPIKKYNKENPEQFYVVGCQDSIKYDTIQTEAGTDSLINPVTIVFGCDTIYNYARKRDVVLSAVVDSNFYYGLIGANSPDGSKNTDLIIKAKLPRSGDSSSSAAMRCRNYYRTSTVASAAEAYKATQGMWYLPSIEELRHLYNAKDKINDIFASAVDENIKRGTLPVFELLSECYWSSSERDAKTAWYKCLVSDGSESYLSKNNTNVQLVIRPIRKVKL